MQIFDDQVQEITALLESVNELQIKGIYGSMTSYCQAILQSNRLLTFQTSLQKTSSSIDSLLSHPPGFQAQAPPLAYWSESKETDVSCPVYVEEMPRAKVPPPSASAPNRHYRPEDEVAIDIERPEISRLK